MIISLDLAVLGASVMLLVGLIPLLFRHIDSHDEGIPLSREEHKILFELIDRFCGRLKCRSPDVVLLTPMELTAISNSWVSDEGAKKPKRERALLLGAGHIVHLRADEFLTVLCHELAHEAGGDTWFRRVVLRFFNSMTAAIELQQNNSLIVRFLGWALTGYYNVFGLFYSADCRNREFRVDRIAASVCGPQDVRNALMKLHLAKHIPRLSLDNLFTEFAMKECGVRNVYREYQDRWERLTIADVERAETEMFLHKHSLWCSHPCLTDRMRNLAGVEAKELVLDKSAMRLFSNWAKHEELITNLLVSFRRYVINEHFNALDRELRYQPRG